MSEKEKFLIEVDRKEAYLLLNGLDTLRLNIGKSIDSKTFINNEITTLMINKIKEIQDLAIIIAKKL